MNSVKHGLNNLSSLLIILIAAVVFTGCAGTPKTGVGVMDNAWHQYVQGMEALEQGDHDEGAAKFDRALSLIPEFPAALAGKSLTTALRAANQKEVKYRKVDVEAALNQLNEARKATDSPEEKFIYHVTAIRVYTQTRGRDWLDKATEHHESAMDVKDLDISKLPYYKDRSASDYFMAEAWFREDFTQSEPLLKKVLAASRKGKWLEKANTLFSKIQRISRAASHSTLTGDTKKIAVLDQVSRGDVAAILISELKLDKLFAGRISVSSQKPKAEFTPADVLEHPFRKEIATIMAWNVRGLEPIYDQTTRANLFKPQQSVSRKELALILEEVIIRLTNQPKIATESVGSTSRFPDVPATVGWFNATMTVVTRGLMKTSLSGEFRPNDTVDGSELLLAVFELRNVINIH